MSEACCSGICTERKDFCNYVLQERRRWGSMIRVTRTTRGNGGRAACVLSESLPCMIINYQGKRSIPHALQACVRKLSSETDENASYLH